MTIARDEYLEKLQYARGNGMVKIITGVRRVGKSYLLFNLFQERLVQEGVEKSHIVAINLEAEGNERFWNPIALGEYIRGLLSEEGRYYVFLDEIQRVGKVLPEGIDLERVAPEDREDMYVTVYDVLNGLNDRGNVDLYVTGSNSKMLSSDIATNFRGRSVEIRVWPLSFAEIYAMGGREKAELWDDYLMFGGMPQAVLEKNPQQRATLLEELFERVYFRDLIERMKLTDDGVLSEVTDALCSAVGSLTNPNRIHNTLRSVQGEVSSVPTLKKYMNALVSAFLFEKAIRFDVRGRRYLDHPVKYFSVDTGLRNARINFREPEKAHLMENVIYLELRRRGYKVDVGVVEVQKTVAGKRETKRHEIDFVVNTGFGKVYIQSAFSIDDPEKRKAETESLRSCRDFFRKIVIVSGFQHPTTDEDGISYVGVIPFLLDRKMLVA